MTNITDITQHPYYEDFITWAQEYFGQGYSLETEEGSFVDTVTRWSFKAYCVGRDF